MKYFACLIKFPLENKNEPSWLGAFQSHGRGWEFTQFFFSMKRQEFERGKKGDFSPLQHHTGPRLRRQIKLSYLFKTY